MSIYVATRGGLTVEQDCHGWKVTHAASGLSAATGLRQRRFAEQARTELLATGVDFTGTAREVQTARRQWTEVYYRWQARSKATALDPETCEYYSQYVRYGQLVPSAAKAAQLRGETS